MERGVAKHKSFKDVHVHPNFFIIKSNNQIFPCNSQRVIRYGDVPLAVICIGY